jgi:serine/threonine protein phosphatase PrpC
MNEYNFFALSEQGKSHIDSNTPCQDASEIIIRDNSMLIAVADGLGSKKLSQIGSELAVRYACRAYRNKWFTSSKDILLSARSHLIEFAKKINLTDPSELATTLQIAIVTEDKADMCICGDGAIVYTVKDEHKLVTDGQIYELANLTFHLLSDNLDDKIFSHIVEEQVQHVSLCSDGMRTVLANERESIAHPPIFDYLINYASQNSVEEAVQMLVNSSQVLESVDDDRSLASFVRVNR